MTTTLLTVDQTKQINAAAAMLRQGDRETFLKDVASLLGRHPTDNDVSAAIHDVLGVRPHDSHLGNF